MTEIVGDDEAIGLIPRVPPLYVRGAAPSVHYDRLDVPQGTDFLRNDR